MKGFLCYGLLQTGKTIHTVQLQRSNEDISLKRPFTSKSQRPVKFLHDNARPHIARSVKDTLVSLGWEVMEHLAYSPYIAPYDCHLFRSMHNSLTDVHLETFEEWVEDFIMILLLN